MNWDEAYASVRRMLGKYMSSMLEQRPGLMAQLRPRTADYHRVFEPDFAADAAEHGYRQLWGNAPLWPVPADASFEVHCATADAFPDAFPGGYREIACYLKKDVVWAAWSVFSGVRTVHGLYDGLAEVEPGRWAWFPRPWKALPNPPAPTLWTD
jgi:hypothetical protein